MLKLSVVIPVYNVELYLSKCIDSVLSPGVDALKQGLSPEYEVIIVNDGSTDSSQLIAEKYCKMYPAFIKLVNQANGGLGNARNTGIEHASGEYIYFLDSDDFLIPGGMEAILASLEKNYDICFFDTIAINTDGKELKYMKGCQERDSLSLEDFPELLLQAPHAWNKIYRTSLYVDNNIRYPDRVWFEDICTVLKLYCFTDKIIYIPQAWHRYLQRKDSILNTGKILRNNEIIIVLDKIIAFYKYQGLWDKYGAILEYLAFYNQYITATVRVCLADWKSPVLKELTEDFVNKFPDYRCNPYVKCIGKSHRLLLWLIERKLFFAVHVIMKTNNILKNKKI